MKTLQKTKQFLSKNKGFIAMGGVLMLASVDASAWTTPSTGDSFYQAYDIVVNDFLKGPIGFVSGLVMIGVGIISLVNAAYKIALPAILAGGLLSSADTLTTSLGASINLLG